MSSPKLIASPSPLASRRMNRSRLTVVRFLLTKTHRHKFSSIYHEFTPLSSQYFSSSVRLAASGRELLVHRNIDNMMAGRSDDGQLPCKKPVDNTTTSRLLYISMEMELKARDDLLKLDMDMHGANVLHADMLGRLERLGNKLKKTQKATEKLQIMIKNATDEIEKSKNDRDDMLADRRKLEKLTTYYDFVKHLLNNDPENSALWYFTGAECPVCLDKYKGMAKLNHCQHLLCVNCLTSMFETSQSCPLCRCEIIGYDVFDRILLRTEHVTITQHYSRTSKIVVDTNPVSEGSESVQRPSAVGGIPGIRLRNDLYHIQPILEGG
ncbi:hypothetical protein QTP88_015250 [Uroleucon formosanum]